MLFRYVTRSKFIAMAGRTCASWRDPTQHVFPPKVDAFLTNLNSEAYEKFALALFRKTGLPFLHDKKRLLEFCNQMIASFLMHLEEMEDDLGSDDMVIHNVVKAAKEFGITKGKLLI